jgi:hypothetical protein
LEQNSEERARRERTAMNLVRDSVSRAPESEARWTLQKLLALGAALLLSAGIFLGFDLFLTAMQKFMDIEVEEEAVSGSEPMAVFAVPEAEGPAPAISDDDDAEPWLPTLELDEGGAGSPAEAGSDEEGPGRTEPPGR